MKWPGYQHIEYRKPIVFIYHGRLCSTGALARQIACHFRRFIEVLLPFVFANNGVTNAIYFQSHGRNFNGQGVLLGPNGLTLDRLRLHQLYCSDNGFTWHAEVSYIPL